MDCVTTLAIWIILAMVGFYIGNNKGRGSEGFFLGLILGPLGLLIAIFMKPKAKSLEGTALIPGTTRKCPFCAELVKREAVICKHCQRDLPPEADLIPELPAALQPGYSRCPECNAAVNDESVKCWSCDTRIRTI